MTIKTKIETLIKSFKEAVATYNAKKAELQDSKKYSADFIAAEIAKLDVEMASVISDANSKLHGIFQESIDEITAKKSGGADFEGKLSNALAFINTLGDKLTDETAFGLIQPFFADYQTMHRLSLVLAEKQGIPATVFTVSGYDAAIESLTNLQTNFKTYFNDMGSPLTAGVSNEYLMNSIDEYETQVDRVNQCLSASADDAVKVVNAYNKTVLGM